MVLYLFNTIMRTEEWNINKKQLGNENIMTFCKKKKKYVS